MRKGAVRLDPCCSQFLERAGLEHVLATADAAIHVNLDFLTDRRDDGRQSADAAVSAVELAPAMVRHNQCIGTGADRKACVFSILDSLEYQLTAPALLDPCHVVPVQRRVQLAGDPLRNRSHVLDARYMADDVAKAAPGGAQHAHAPAPLGRQIAHGRNGQFGWGRQTVFQVFVPLAQNLQIQCNNQGRAFRILGPLDQLRNMGGSRFFVSLNNEEIIINPITNSPQKTLVINKMQTILREKLGPSYPVNIEFSRPNELKVLNNETLLTDLPPSWASYSLLTSKLNLPILVLQIELSSNEWLYLAALMPPPYIVEQRDLIPSPQLTTIMLTTLFLLLFTFVLFQWQTRPLARLARAASDMSIDLHQAPLKEEGALELLTATRAFNNMQQKLQRIMKSI